MIIRTRYGELEIEEGKIIYMEGPILGFESVREYALLPVGEGATLYLLQAVYEPSLGFFVTDPRLVMPTYDPNLTAVRHALAIATDDELALLGLITFREAPLSATINLRAPLVINARTYRGKQVVLDDDRFSLRHPLRELSAGPTGKSVTSDPNVRAIAGHAFKHSD